MRIYHLECQGCKRSVRLKTQPIPPVRCACGSEFTSFEPLPIPPVPFFADQRRTICAECPHRVDLTCTLLTPGKNILEGGKGIPNPNAKCPDGRWYPAITIRNLIYHVYPAGDWESIANEIASNLNVFNGKRIIAIADPGGMNIQGVAHRCREMFNTDNVTIYPNDPVLRETVTFKPLLHSVLNNKPNEATFYAHTKANSTADNVNGATLWRQVMVDNLLGRWEHAMTHLQTHTFVGTHKMIWPADKRSPFPTRLIATYPWMHCGTFWWFRHDQINKLFTPESIINDRYGVEAWPAQLIPPQEAYSMWQPWEEHERAWPQRNPYDPGLYNQDYSR